jgi:hypothetical protein
VRRIPRYLLTVQMGDPSAAAATAHNLRFYRRLMGFWTMEP